MDTRHTKVGIGFSTDPDLREAARERLAERLRVSRIDARAPLEDFSLSTDEFQRRVIESAAQTIRMVAPAGSGKTQTLVNRVLHRVAEGVPGHRILLLTFDNSAAQSIRAKIDDVARQSASVADALARVDVSTLNAFGYRLLRENVRAEYGNVVRPRDAAFRLRRLQRELADVSEAHAASLPDHLRDRVYLELFSVLKNQLIDPRAVDEQQYVDSMVTARQGEPFLIAPQNDQILRLNLEAVLWLFRRYDESLRGDGLLDFDDQKLRAYVAMRDKGPLRAAIEARFDEVVVDEFQDINRLDFVLIETLARSARLVVTGDDDQAIYGFRGTTPDYIIDLETHLERPVESFELSINYRCPPNIVEHAERLIRHNTRRIAKTPKPHLTEPSEIQVVSTISTGLEAGALIDYIERLRRTTERFDTPTLRCCTGSMPRACRFRSSSS